MSIFMKVPGTNIVLTEGEKQFFCRKLVKSGGKRKFVKIMGGEKRGGKQLFLQILEGGTYLGGHYGVTPFFRFFSHTNTHTLGRK